MDSLFNFESVVLRGKKDHRIVKDTKNIQRVHDQLKLLADKITPESDYVLLNDTCRELNFISTTYNIDLLDLANAFTTHLSNYQIKARLIIELKGLDGATDKTILSAISRACVTKFSKGPEALLNKFRSLNQFDRETEKQYMSRVISSYSKILALGATVTDFELTHALTNVRCPMHKTNIETQLAVNSPFEYANKLIALGILESERNRENNRNTNNISSENTFKNSSGIFKKKSTFLCRLCKIPSCKGPKTCGKSRPYNFRSFSNENKTTFAQLDKKSGSITCYKCKKQGHISTHCPEKKSIHSSYSNPKRNENTYNNPIAKCAGIANDLEIENNLTDS